MASTLFEVLEWGDRASPALVVGSGGRTFTRGEVHALATKFAMTLIAGGIKAGDVVTIAEPNTVEFVIAFLGCTYARGIAAPLNQNYTKSEFSYYMEDANSKLLVVGPNGNEAAESAALESNIPAISLALSNHDNDDNRAVVVNVQVKEGKFRVTDVNDKGEELAALPHPNDVALFLHTSGTTSRPKGVPLTHGNLTASLANISKTYEFSNQDVSLLVMPLFHVHGLMAGLLAPLSSGASVVLPSAGRFSAGTFWEDAVACGVTYYTAVPTMHQILVSRAATDFPKDNPPPLRVIRSCSSSLAPATLEQVEKAFGAPVLEAYAMTEASHQMTSNPLPKYGSRKPGTVGVPQGSLEVTILGPAPDFRKLSRGEVGEVCIRGPNVTSGYVNNPAANADSFVRGWFRTGDQGKLDEDGYLTLTGRIKELINRGGEKISPIEVDGVLLSHPFIAEAVSFAAPDVKYGEVVAAAVVLNESGREEEKKGSDVVKGIQEYCSGKLAAFKVPNPVFLAEQLPKTATGKVQRRLMVDAFLPSKVKSETLKPNTSAAASDSMDSSDHPQDGFFLVAHTLAQLGIKFMFGVVGIPVTQLASAAQACGIRFIGCRNEQAAGYAASAVGFLTGTPAVLLTVSGPGVVHGLAGLSNAKINCWPLLMLSGSCETSEIGKGAFQELDQVETVHSYVKLALKPQSLEDIPTALLRGFQATTKGRPGAAYIDLPSDILMRDVGQAGLGAVLQTVSDSIHAEPASTHGVQVSEAELMVASELISSAKRPLIIIGKGAAYSKAELSMRMLIDACKIPFLSTSMGRGTVPDDHPLCVNAARSMALSQADVAVIFGARLNWQLHFGEPPKWSSSVKFILIDPEPCDRDASCAAAVLRADAGATASRLTTHCTVNCEEWLNNLQAKALAASSKLELRLQHTAHPLDYSTVLRILRNAIRELKGPAPIVVAEGANTMDQARLILGPVREPRCRLDAGTWGTMGVGPGYAIAAAVACPERQIIALEGDSAFGFSAMEIETACRYSLPILFIVMNNGGIYGGDRRTAKLQALASKGLSSIGHPYDPAPTAFVADAKYYLLAEAFGGIGVQVDDAPSFQRALLKALDSRKTTIIDVVIDPMAGVESGNVHAFNAPKPTQS